MLYKLPFRCNPIMVNSWKHHSEKSQYCLCVWIVSVQIFHNIKITIVIRVAAFAFQNQKFVCTSSNVEICSKCTNKMVKNNTYCRNECRMRLYSCRNSGSSDQMLACIFVAIVQFLKGFFFFFLVAGRYCLHIIYLSVSWDCLLRVLALCLKFYFR